MLGLDFSHLSFSPSLSAFNFHWQHWIHSTHTDRVGQGYFKERGKSPFLGKLPIQRTSKYYTYSQAKMMVQLSFHEVESFVHMPTRRPFYTKLIFGAWWLWPEFVLFQRLWLLWDIIFLFKHRCIGFSSLLHVFSSCNKIWTRVLRRN